MLTKILSSLFLVVSLMSASAMAQGRGTVAEAERITGDRFAVSTRTQNGTNIYSVRRPSAAMLAAIDQGLTNLFAVARKNGYSRQLNYSNYTIFIANADRNKSAAGQYSPDIAIGAAQYAGTDYDQGGYVYAAGMVLSFSPMTFVIAEHTKEFNRVSDVVRYEGEHLVLYYNDRRRYSQTADHSKGGGHPILQ
ncbi:MAG TPA: hypothetical protein VMZ26_14670 [Pyrinomonadaceae bacterium]|nr:hypothetical protein [Pyrinomonadaceae bacterium]